MANEPPIDAFVCGGYLLVQPYVAPEDSYPDWVPKDVVGSPVVTTSPCFADVLPSEWAFKTWLPPPSREEQETAANGWGIPVTAVSDAIAWAHRSADEGRVLHHDAFADVATARAFADRFLPPSLDVRLLGIGLLRDAVPGFLRAVADRDAVFFGAGWGGPNGVRDGVERRVPFEAEATPLGYEVLSVALGEDRHSWHCESIERRFRDELGIRPAEGGLLRRYEEANKVAAVLNDEGVGCTVGLWRPWLVVEYDLRFAGQGGRRRRALTASEPNLHTWPGGGTQG